MQFLWRYLAPSTVWGRSCCKNTAHRHEDESLTLPCPGAVRLKTALKQNSQLIKSIVKVGVKEMAGNPVFPSRCVVAVVVARCPIVFFSLLRSRLVPRRLKPVIKKMRKWKCVLAIPPA